MVSDSISSCSVYKKLHKHFPAAFDFILKNDLSKFTHERHDILGDDLYIIISEFEGKAITESKPECHKKYIDIHYLIDGEETIGYLPKEDCKEPLTPFDEEKDFELYNDTPLNYVNMKKGMFSIFFPEDAHAPGIGNNLILKAVVKIKIE